MNKNNHDNFSDSNIFSGNNKGTYNGNKDKRAFNVKANNKRKKFHQQGRYYHQNCDVENPDNNIDNYPPSRKKKKQNNTNKANKTRLIAKSKRKAQSQNKSNPPTSQGAKKLNVKNHVYFDNKLPEVEQSVLPVVNDAEKNFKDCSKTSLVSSVINESNAANSINIANKLFAMNEQDLFRWLINPVQPETFKKNYWEKSPIFIDRNIPGHYCPLNVTTKTVDTLLRENHVLFGKNIDITTYTDGVRETHNPVGRAQAHIVWDFFKNGCSVRFLNPQTYINSVYRLNEKLQRYFDGFVGSNLYLTPPNSQGFAPHYDDIEAFVLQLQGTKYWKVYRPRMQSEELPRYSSPNFTEEEVGQPILEVVLKPGDLLYFPRGFIHQASTRDDLSLHITLSAYQCTAYIDLFEKLLPDVLRKAARDDIEFRKGLPLKYSTHLGHAQQRGTQNQQRREFKMRIMKMAEKLIDYIDQSSIDSAVDSLAAKSLHDQLPPYFSAAQKRSMIFSNSTKLSNDCKTVHLVQLKLTTLVRLASPKICRLVKTDDKYLLYHSVNNSMEYHGNDEEFLEVPKESEAAFRILYQTYPKYTKIKNLPIDDDEDKWSFANSLWEVGLLTTQKPLNSIKTDFSGNIVGNKGEEDADDSVADEEDYEDGSDVNDDKVESDLSGVTVDTVKNVGLVTKGNIPIESGQNSASVIEDSSHNKKSSSCNGNDIVIID